MKNAAWFVFACLSVARAAEPQYFLLTYELAPGVELAHLSPGQIEAAQQHHSYLTRLRDQEVLSVAGRTLDAVHTTGIGIVTAENDAAARALAAQDPGVRAGLMKVSVQAFELAVAPATAAPIVPDAKKNFDLVAKYVLDAARKMPAERYGFRASPDVRTFAQLLAHIAESQYIGCSVVRGEEYQPRGFEQKLSTRAELVPALEAAFANCQDAWNKMSGNTAAGTVTLLGQQRTRLGVMDLATAHTFEHYGNIVTYLRLNGIVPPSSE